MRRSTRLTAAALAAVLALAPLSAFARAGGGMSSGSRGSRTYSAPPSTNTAPMGAQPMQRSFTPQAAPSPSFGGAAPMGAAAGGMSRGSAFTSGLLGGLVGAGIGGMLFGHGMTGGLSGGFSFIGLLLQFALIFFVGRWLFRRFLGGASRPAFAGGIPGMARTAQPTPEGMLPGGGAGGPGGQGIAIGQADYQAFDASLKNIQSAWSAQDMNGLQRLVTPEMAGYFADQMAELASRGVRNSVTAVVLDKGDLAEAWRENGRDYATVAMRFSAIDVTRDASGRVVDGDPMNRTMATELWTFMRASGGQWLLSAIQQTR